MKKILLLVLALVMVQRCTVPAPILSATYSLDLPSGAGVQGNPQFTDLQSSSTGGKTKLTFTNSDGEILEFQISGLQPGNSYELSGVNSIVGSMKINDETGQLTLVQFEGTGVGSISVTGLNGSGAAITGMSGSFQSNIQIAGSGQGVGGPTGTGTIIGEIGFNNQQ